MGSKLSAMEARRLVAMSERNIPMAKLCREFGVCARTVKKYRKAAGLDTARDSAREFDKARNGPNPCVDCVHSVPDGRGHGCPWTIGAMFRDVPGWTVRRYRREGKEAVQILHCPMFERG